MIRLLRNLCVVFGLVLLPACDVMLFSEEYMNEMGLQAYTEVTKEYREVRGTPEATMVMNAGRKIAEASGANYQWEFKLLESKEPNAFCLPGGKIAIYSGILPITQNEAALAAVMGHEVAHATLQHGNKRMSQGMLMEIGLVGVAAALEYSKVKEEHQMMVLAALGIGANLGVILPYSRDHESEADEVGLRYAVRAGYDPEEAPRLWERMAKLGGGGPEFLSTHPDPLKRAERLREITPKIVAEERDARPRR